MTEQPKVTIRLTPEQQAQIRETTGTTVPAVKLALELLEPRLAPGRGIN